MQYKSIYFYTYICSLNKIDIDWKYIIETQNIFRLQNALKYMFILFTGDYNFI